MVDGTDVLPLASSQDHKAAMMAMDPTPEEWVHIRRTSC